MRGPGEASYGADSVNKAGKPERITMGLQAGIMRRLCPCNGIFAMTKLMPFLLVAVLVAACAKEQSGAPMPERKPTRLELHGDVRIDNYFWLKERDNPDVIAYLDAENAYTEKMMAPMQGMQELLLVLTS